MLTGENTLLVEKTLANGLTEEVALAESAAPAPCAGRHARATHGARRGGNTVAELPILAGEDVGHVTFVQMLGRARCLARGFCMGPLKLNPTKSGRIRGMTKKRHKNFTFSLDKTL